MKRAQRTESNVESVKVKSSEELFYKYLEESLQGCVIKKVAPFTNLYFDLLYIEENKVALFKFMDTNEDTFSILADEIMEVMQEEEALLQKYAQESFGLHIPYYFVMPYISLSEHQKESSIIIDKAQFEDLINRDCNLTQYLSDVGDKSDEVLLTLAKEYFVFTKHSFVGDKVLDLDYRQNRIKATLLEKEQRDRVNELNYGTTLLEGSTGTGKTTLMLAKLIKLARTYPKDNFLYITFDKQLSNAINRFISYFHKDVHNIKVINFHQFVLMLGKRFSLKLNKSSKQSFNKEFEKVFEKVAKIYEGKRYFKGIFVDESENFNVEEMLFLRNIAHPTKYFLYLSYDEAKRMAPFGEKALANTLDYDERVVLRTNYRSSEKVGYFNLDFQNDINAFSALELDRMDNYFQSFSTVSSLKGNAQVIEYPDTPQMLEELVSLVKRYLDEGYLPSDICIIYPYNEKVVRANRAVYSKHLIKKVMDDHSIVVTFADDESGNLQNSTGITLSNIYNCTNLEWKVVILCQLDTLYNCYTTLKNKEVQKMLNIIYTASGRAIQDLYIMIRKDEHRPGIIDLLSQKI